jgi:hypothetical protein
MSTPEKPALRHRKGWWLILLMAWDNLWRRR